MASPALLAVAFAPFPLFTFDDFFPVFDVLPVFGMLPFFDSSFSGLDADATPLSVDRAPPLFCTLLPISFSMFRVIAAVSRRDSLSLVESEARLGLWICDPFRNLLLCFTFARPPRAGFASRASLPPP